MYSPFPTTSCRTRDNQYCSSIIHMWICSCREVQFINNKVCLLTPRFLHPLTPFCSALTDISKSISLYLHDEKSAYRVLAIDLCSRGFHVWQHYIDAIEILRSLFNLATNTRKDAISTQNVAVQARAAVLSIAANNTPLFITTLCLDILTPLTLEHRRSVMQIVAYLIRKV